IVLVHPKLAIQGAWAGLAGVLVLIGFAVARANIVFPALTVPELEALQNAFYDPRLQFVYFPSPMEWAVSAGLVGLAVLAFLIGQKWLQVPRPKEA
ncbi:MAG: polysulfide reductase, partial [Candidatus Bipolaricaulota bacterium]|nr:polysulfide reductase [Candidatus Bipolaricaulota bacterium]